MSFLDERNDMHESIYPTSVDVEDQICSAPRCAAVAFPGTPWPICPQHLRQIYEFARPIVDERMTAAVAEVVDKQSQPVIDYRSPGWVYFIRIGEEIKIGWSSRPSERFRTLRPSAVLVMRRGSPADERRYHGRFAHLRVHGEYFEPGLDLMEYIDSLIKLNAVAVVSTGTLPDTEREREL